VGELGEALLQLGAALLVVLRELLGLVVRHILLLAWLAWWLGGANWKKLWPVLGRGGWAVLLLLWVTAALVWSQLEPKAWDGPAGVSVPNFWWQLGGVGLLVAVTLLCGWLQGVFHWTPSEIELEPQPAHDTAHEVGHGHGPQSVMGPDPGHEPPHGHDDHPHGHSHTPAH
jgi:hypothetical protein